MSLQEFRALKKKSKYNAVRCEVDGIKFDSRAEGEFYKLLKSISEVKHIDVHPTVTLPGGIRYKPDFMVYLHDNRIAFYEVKGAVSQDFRRMRKLFDASHPMGPLQVWRKAGKRWEKI